MEGMAEHKYKKSEKKSLSHEKEETPTPILNETHLQKMTFQAESYNASSFCAYVKQEKNDRVATNNQRWKWELPYKKPFWNAYKNHTRLKLSASVSNQFDAPRKRQ